MIIIAGGDSFVYGSELSDCRDNVTIDQYGHSSKTFTGLLAKNLSYNCVAWPGYANESIARTVMAEINRHENCGVVVCWTFPGRYEFRFSYDTRQRKSPWFAFNSWTVQDPKNLSQHFLQDNCRIEEVFEKHHIVAKQSGTAHFAKTFYEHVGNSEYWEVYVGLKEIVFLQNYLKIKQIPYLFTCADNSLLNNYTIQNADEFISSLYNQIDMQHWFWFPPGQHQGETTSPRGFYQWAMENKYPVGTTHPLDEAHYDAAKLMEGKFNELVKKPLEQNTIRN